MNFAAINISRQARFLFFLFFFLCIKNSVTPQKTFLNEANSTVNTFCTNIKNFNVNSEDPTGIDTIPVILVLQNVLSTIGQMSSEQQARIKAAGQELIRKLLIRVRDKKYLMQLLLNQLLVNGYEPIKKHCQELVQKTELLEQKQELSLALVYLDTLIPLQIIAQETLNLALAKNKSLVSTEQLSLTFPETITPEKMLTYFTTMKAALTLIKSSLTTINQSQAKDPFQQQRDRAFSQAEEKLTRTISLITDYKSLETKKDTEKEQTTHAIIRETTEKLDKIYAQQLYAHARTLATEENPKIIQATLSQLLLFFPQTALENPQAINQDELKTSQERMQEKIKKALEPLKTLGAVGAYGTQKIIEQLFPVLKMTGQAGTWLVKNIHLIFPLIIGGALMLGAYGLVYGFLQHACMQILMMTGMAGINTGQLGYLAANGLNLFLNKITLDYFPLLTRAKSWQGALAIYNKNHAAELFYTLKSIVGVVGLLGSLTLELILSYYLRPALDALMISFHVDPRGKVGLLLHHGMKLGILVAIAVFCQAEIIITEDDSYKMLTAQEQVISAFNWVRSSFGSGQALAAV